MEEEAVAAGPDSSLRPRFNIGGASRSFHRGRSPLLKLSRTWIRRTRTESVGERPRIINSQPAKLHKVATDWIRRSMWPERISGIV